MRAILASGLGLALVTITGAAPADEAPLPAGWVRGGGLAPMPPPRERAFGTFQANHEFTFRARQAMPGARRDVGALPVVPIDPSALPAAPPAELPEGAAADATVSTKNGYYRLSLRGFDIGFVQVNGSRPAAVGPRGEGGAAGACGDRGDRRVVPVSYEGLRRVDRGGAVELVWARGWLDTGRCRAAIVERHDVRPEPLGGGVAYAFRTRCAACGEDARDVIHVLTPQTGDLFDRRTPFEHHTLPFGPGRTAAFEGVTRFRLGGWAELPDWEAVIDRRCGTDTVWCTKRVRVEVSQGRGEPSPTLFVSGDVAP